MVRIIILFAVVFTGGLALFRPWVSIGGYYLYTIWGPQYIWWWNFQGLRIANILAIGAILGVVFNCLKKNHYSYKFLLNKQNAFLALLWFSLIFSHQFGAYSGNARYFDSYSAQIFSLTNNIFIMYFISVLEINKIRKIRLFFFVFTFSTIHLLFWANYQYISQNWNQFNFGRLMGPSGLGNEGVYRDENAFAMFFVCGLPFIYYWGLGFKKLIFRWSIWATLPLGVHAIFLTGSRGGLLGVGTVLLAIIFLSKHKFMAIPIVVTSLLFFQYQAGDVMKHRSDQITNIEGESSAEDRLTAWIGGGRMILSHPLNGVGLGMFVVALPDYIESRNMVAHNTVIQFSSESGVLAGVAYLASIFLFFRNAIKVFLWSGKMLKNEEIKKIYFFNNAAFASFTGLVVCSLFLSLNTYEVFFILILINNAIYQLCSSNNWHGCARNC